MFSYTFVMWKHSESKVKILRYKVLFLQSAQSIHSKFTITQFRLDHHFVQKSLLKKKKNQKTEDRSALRTYIISQNYYANRCKSYEWTSFFPEILLKQLW